MSGRFGVGLLCRAYRDFRLNFDFEALAQLVAEVGDERIARIEAGENPLRMLLTESSANHRLQFGVALDLGGQEIIGLGIFKRRAEF